MPFIIVLVFIFLILWPFLGQFIAYLGKQFAQAPGGVDGLAYGILGRALMPLGLHHIVIGLAFQTSLGGVLTLDDVQAAGNALGITNHPDFQILVKELSDPNKFNKIVMGDQNIWNFINGLPLNYLPTNMKGGTLPVFQWFTTHIGVYAGRFTQDYPTYLGVVQGIGLAMILVVKKEHRKKALAVIGSSMFVAFLTGITEPLEFSFLFAAPLFYYLIYVPLSGFSYMFMKLTGAHVGVGFARGFVDYIIFGAVPVKKGTQFYWAIPLAAVMGLFSFALMYFGIKKFKWKTPFMDPNQLSLIDKKTWKNLTANKTKNTNQEVEQLFQAYGGAKNITSISACATRLRINVLNISLVDERKIIGLGAQGFIKKGTSTQAIFGGKAQILAEAMQFLKNQ